MNNTICSFDVGTRHLAFCIIDKATEQIKEWENIDLGQENQFQTETLIQELSKFPEIWDCETVLIERQPSLNPKMKSFSNELKMFLTIRKIDFKKNCDIRFYSSKYKTDFFSDSKTFEFPDSIYKTQNGKKMTNYMRTKKEGLYLMNQLIFIQNNPDIIQFYLGNTQMCKRDLADSFLQGLSFIRKTRRNVSTITARKPTKRQTKYKKYSKSNLKFLWRSGESDSISDFVETYRDSIRRNYGFSFSLDDVKRDLLT